MLVRRSTDPHCRSGACNPNRILSASACQISTRARSHGAQVAPSMTRKSIPRGTPLRPSARGQVGDRDNKGPSIDCGIWRVRVILRLPKPEPVVSSLREMLVERVSHIGAVMVLFVSSGEAHLRPSARRSARAVFYALQFFFPNLSYSRRFLPRNRHEIDRSGSPDRDGDRHIDIASDRIRVRADRMSTLECGDR
jgi:hypothetical protein